MYRFEVDIDVNFKVEVFEVDVDVTSNVKTNPPSVSKNMTHASEKLDAVSYVKTPLLVPQNFASSFQETTGDPLGQNTSARHEDERFRTQNGVCVCVPPSQNKDL